MAYGWFSGGGKHAPFRIGDSGATGGAVGEGSPSFGYFRKIWKIAGRLVPGGLGGWAQLLLDRVHDLAPVGETAGISFGIQFIGLLFREIAAGEPVLGNQHPGDEVYIRLYEHLQNVLPECGL